MPALFGAIIFIIIFSALVYLLIAGTLGMFR